MADTDLSSLMPGGVNSPVRSFAGAGPGIAPIIAASGSGARIVDGTGRELIDYIHGWGSVIAGHAHPGIIAAVEAQAAAGLGFGLTTELERRFAAELARRTGLPMSRAVSSGTEATMTAIRLGRAASGRDLLLKFAGCYHGHSDSLLVAAGSGAQTFGSPSSAGVPAAAAGLTAVLPYNDTEALERFLAERGGELAAAIVEPIAGNMNLILPEQGFIDALAAGCRRHGAVLISDEVMTGLRAAPGLAMRDRFGIEPDIACLGKVIGGGLPAAAVCGKRGIMELLAPLGPVYQAGTLSGNPLCLAAGLAALELLDREAWERLERATGAFAAALNEEARTAGVDGFRAVHAGGMAGFAFRADPPADLADVEATSQRSFEIFHREMLAGGVLLPPSRFEACFLGLAHGEDTLEQSRHAMWRAFAALAAEADGAA